MTGGASAPSPPPPNGKGGDPLSAVVNRIKQLNAQLQELCDYIERELLPKPEKLEEARDLIMDLVQYVQREVIDRKEWFQGQASGGHGAPADRAAVVVSFEKLRTAAGQVYRKLQTYEQIVRHHHDSESRLSAYTTERYRKEVRALEEEGVRIAESVRSFVDDWILLTQNIVASRADPPASKGRLSP
jgi:hypothetical protein